MTRAKGDGTQSIALTRPKTMSVSEIPTNPQWAHFFIVFGPFGNNYLSWG